MESADGKETRARTRLRNLLRLLWGIAFFLAALLLLRLFIVAPYRISTGSMEPALQGDHPELGLEGDMVLVLKAAYFFSRPRRWDLVAFTLPGRGQGDGQEAGSGIHLVKRVVGLPGEKVEIRSRQLFIDDQPMAFRDLSYIGKDPYGNKAVVLGENEYFVLGDNSYLSEDSRQWGPLPGKNIFGRVIFILRPWSRAGWIE